MGLVQFVQGEVLILPLGILDSRMAHEYRVSRFRTAHTLYSALTNISSELCKFVLSLIQDLRIF
jgi:hypothetical protein